MINNISSRHPLWDVSIFYQLFAVLSLLLFSASASANHLHYLTVEDTSYGPVIADEVSDPTLPLNTWIIYNGDPAYSIVEDKLVTYVREPGVVVSQTSAVFDAPASENITNPRTTAFFQVEVKDVDPTRLGPSFDVGMTDLVHYLKLDHNAKTFSTDNQDVIASERRLSFLTDADFNDYPLIIKMYHHFSDNTSSIIVENQAGKIYGPYNLSLSSAPFINLFGHIEGTDPDNMIIYPYVICNIDCAITMRTWGIAQCDSVDGGVDIANCEYDTSQITSECSAEISGGGDAKPGNKGGKKK